MAHWDHGYVTDVAYTTNFYREITPSWLATCSLLLGQRPPELTKPFSYADLGCGNGFTTLIVAATSPQADVWGFDFNPSHVEFATRLAARAGLTNAHFVETSFADLAAMPEGALPHFDMMVSHGVLSWISSENRRHLMATVGRRLKPGGLCYLSYNVTTGWTAMVPVRALMRMVAEASPERTDIAAPAALDFIDRLREAGAGFFKVNSNLDSRLQDIRRQDPRYIAHEYLNQDWHPLMFSEVAAGMAEARCRYVGSGTLAENIESVSVPAGVLPLMAEARDIVLRETIRDLGCAQGFRRDLYRRGMSALPSAEQQMLLERAVLVGLGRSVPEGGITFATPIGTVTGLASVYDPLVAMLDAGPVSVAAARQIPAFAGKPLVELLQAFTLLIAGGYAHPTLPDGGTAASREACRRLNQAISGINAAGADLTQLAAPAIGSATGSDVFEIMVIGELLGGRPAEIGALATEIVATLARSGRGVQRDGQPVPDPAEARRIAEGAIATVLERRVPVLRQLGVLDG